MCGVYVVCVVCVCGVCGVCGVCVVCVRVCGVVCVCVCVCVGCTHLLSKQMIHKYGIGSTPYVHLDTEDTRQLAYTIIILCLEIPVGLRSLERNAKQHNYP